MSVGANFLVMMRNVVLVSFTISLVFVLVFGIRNTKSEVNRRNGAQPFSFHVKALRFIYSGYQHVWPEMEFGWRIIVGTLIAILGAAFGSVGGIGGGGIFVPMLILIIGFDPKSATAISKCMVTGAAISAVFFCLKQRHPVLDIPMIDYDLVLLIQPMLMLGVSIGVLLSVIFANWMITLLLIILCLGTSIRAFFKGVEAWTKETRIKESQETVKLLESTDRDAVILKENTKVEGSILSNIYWKQFGFLSFVWLAYLVIQIAKTYTASCSTPYWILNSLQIPVSLGVHVYQAVGLYHGRGFEGNEYTQWQLQHLILSGVCALLAGIVAGLLGIGAGFVMGPIFLEVGIAPQVVSATCTFGMIFSASTSVIQYYLLNRFPVPYALYLTIVAAIAAYIGQHIIDKLVKVLQRASLIIFVLALTIFVSTIAMGGVGISEMIRKIQRNEYMGFEDLCKYGT